MMPLRIRGSVAARPETAADRFPVSLAAESALAIKEVNFRMVEQRHDRRLTLRCLNTSPYEVRLRAELLNLFPFCGPKHLPYWRPVRRERSLSSVTVCCRGVGNVR